MNTAEYIIPNHFLSALINSDETNLSDADSTALNNFIDVNLKERTHFHALGDIEDEGFIVFHDLRPFGVLACDCCTVLFDIGDDLNV